jgi:hypothetical protein
MPKNRHPPGDSVCEVRRARRTIVATTPAEASMVQTGTLTALFHDLVQEAMEQQHIASSETTECYLVHMLERFAAPGPHRPPRSAARRRLHARVRDAGGPTLRHAETRRRHRALRDRRLRRLPRSRPRRRRLLHGARSKCLRAALERDARGGPGRVVRRARRSLPRLRPRPRRDQRARALQEPSRTRSGSTSAGCRRAARARRICSFGRGLIPVPPPTRRQ